MRVLHITNDYSGSAVYKHLISELDRIGFEQLIYNPIRSKSRVRKNEIEFLQKNSKIFYSNILNSHSDRFLYRKKINKILRDIEKKVNFSKIDFIHAHTWYSDGGVAYILSLKYNIPYGLAVRSTDINIFYKFLIHKRSFGIKILQRANNIFFISEVYRNIFLDLPRIKSRKFELLKKISVLPNGVNDFWLDNIKSKKSSITGNHFNIVYVGTFIKRKKIILLQKAIIFINRNSKINCVLHIAGGGGAHQKKVIAYCERYPDYFKYYGKVKKIKVLEDIYKKGDVFAMPSVHETFGLVYVEAMSQGLPVLYKENEGIDGFYGPNIGEKVGEVTAREIGNKLMKLYENYKHYTIDKDLLIENHRWSNIAKKYEEFYKV